MTSYTVIAKRWARGWELHIDGVGVTQVRSLSVAENTAREYIAFALDVDNENSFDVDVVPQLDAKLTQQVRTVREQVRSAARKQQEAGAKQREVVKELSRTGLSGREIATVLDMSPQRVSQLIGKTSTVSSTSARGRSAVTSRAVQASGRQGAKAVSPAAVKIAGQKNTTRVK